MSWFKVALGLLNTAVGTDAGREVISNVRSAIRKDPAPAEAPPDALNIDAVRSLIATQREEVDRNLEAVVHMLNSQNQKLEELIRRQRRLNLALAAGIVIAVIVAVLT